MLKNFIQHHFQIVTSVPITVKIERVQKARSFTIVPVSEVDFPHFRGHTEKFDIISNLEVYYGRNERSKEIRSGI